jgi:hypothetical protein
MAFYLTGYGDSRDQSSCIQVEMVWSMKEIEAKECEDAKTGQ